MNYAYVRVSTEEQNTARQFDIINTHCEKHNITIDKVYEEKISAKDMNRPELKELLNSVKENDKIFISDLSRIARSTSDLLAIVNEILETKKAYLVSIKEDIDPSTITGKMILTIIGAINEFERNNIKELQSEGILKARIKGVRFGRKPTPKPNNWDIVFKQYISKNITAKEAIELLGITKSLFYSLLTREEGVNFEDRKVIKPDNFDQVACKYLFGKYTKKDAISILKITQYAFDKFLKEYKNNQLTVLEQDQ